jgi:TetR/AcrR family transcriptional regulator, copper-responsive repressor
MNEATIPSRPRGRPRTFDRDAALECAMLLFWSRGYEATSVSALTEAMGMTPPSLYGAFGDKKHLFLEAVDRYVAGYGQYAQRAFATGRTAESTVQRLLMGAVDMFSDPSHPRGCMVVLAATNCTAESSDVLQALADRRRLAERAIRDRIAAGRAAGELQRGADIDALAGMVVATLYGLSLKARDGASRSNMRKIVTQVLRSWPRASNTKSKSSTRASVTR